MSDPFLTPNLRHSNVAMPHVSDQSVGLVQIESSKLMPALILIGVLAGSSLAISIVSSMMQNEKLRLAEREVRIMQDDLKYIRAYLSARGIEVPANHDEAEEQRR